MKMISAIATLAAVLVAVLAAFMTMPVDAAMLLVLLGILAGLTYDMDNIVPLLAAVLVYPIAGAAITAIPTVGDTLGAILVNVGIAAAGAAATVLTRRVIAMVQGSVGSLTGKSAS